MKRNITVAFVFALLLPAASAWAQDNPNVEITQLTDHLYKLTMKAPFETNVTVSAGDDGLLLVDSGSKYAIEDLKGVLKTLGDGQVKTIINTHTHVEHNGGNLAYGRDVLKIGHDRLRTRLTTGAYVLEEYPEEALPNLTFTDSLLLYFNGEKIRLIALPGGHDDDNIIIHFTDSKVACMGALCTGMHFPTVDNRGGNALQYGEVVQKAIDLLPEDVMLIPGHGRNCTMAEEKAFQDMLVRTTAIVKAGIAAGKDVATLQKEKVLEDWASYEGGFTTADQWIQVIANTIQGIQPKQASAVELYQVLKENDADSAVAKWYALKKSNPEEYNFGEGQLVNIGYYLLGKSRIGDAIKIFKLYVKEFPDAWNAYDCLGEAYMKNGENKLARKNYEKSLKLNPDNTNAVEILKKLQ